MHTKFDVIVSVRRNCSDVNPYDHHVAWCKQKNWMVVDWVHEVFLNMVDIGIESARNMDIGDCWQYRLKGSIDAYMNEWSGYDDDVTIRYARAFKKK